MLRAWPFRLVLSLVVSLSLSATVLASASVGSATAVSYLEVQRAWTYQPETDFGVDWHVVYPSGVDQAGWSTYCSLDGDQERECTPESVNSLSLDEGEHVIEMTPRNLSSGEDGETYVWTFIVDATPPVVVQHDDHLLARMGRDIIFALPFREEQTPFGWDCSSSSTSRHVYVSGDEVDPGGTAEVVLPSPGGEASYYDGYQCNAWNRVSLHSRANVWAVWDAEKPSVLLDPGVPPLMTGPLRFGMVAYDSETSSAGERMKIFGQYRTITPRLKRRAWTTPDRWVTSGKSTGGWKRRFRLARVPRGHSVCVRAGARDAVGFRGLSKRTCATRAWDDRDLRRSPGWTEGTPRRAYRRTVLRTGRYGATLKLTRPSMGRAANILVRKCPKCGTIEFIGPNNPYWGFPQLKYSLRAKKRRWAKIPVDWNNHRYYGDYTIRVVTRGKPVVIDGLAVSPRRVYKRGWTES